MMHRTLTIILFALFSSFTCFGQTMYYKLTPGESTRREVEQFLGQPLKKVSETLFEYRPRNEHENYRLYFQYERDTDTDRLGRFIYVGLPGSGTFVVVASAPGYAVDVCKERPNGGHSCRIPISIKSRFDGDVPSPELAIIGTTNIERTD